MAANQTVSAGAPKVRRRSRWGRRLLIVIVLFAIAGFALTRYVMQQQGPQPSVFRATLEQGYPNIVKAMSINDANVPGGKMNPDEVLRFTAKDGLQRLDDASIAKLVQLRARLAGEADQRTCAALWSGDRMNLVPAIESLPDDQQRQWATLFDQAAAAVVNNAPRRPAPTAEQYQEAFNRTMVGIDPADFQLIESAAAQSNASSPPDECKAARIFYGRLAQMNNDDALVVTRATLYQ
jgi:hypothetical protein